MCFHVPFLVRGRVLPLSGLIKDNTCNSLTLLVKYNILLFEIFNISLDVGGNEYKMSNINLLDLKLGEYGMVMAK